MCIVIRVPLMTKPICIGWKKKVEALIQGHVFLVWRKWLTQTKCHWPLVVLKRRGGKGQIGALTPITLQLPTNAVEMISLYCSAGLPVFIASASKLNFSILRYVCKLRDIYWFSWIHRSRTACTCRNRLESNETQIIYWRRKNQPKFN